MQLNAGQSLVVQGYDGRVSGELSVFSIPPIAITVQDHFHVHGGVLETIFETDEWDSTISFQPGIDVNLNGTLELTFAQDVDVASQVGRTFHVFNWAGVAPMGTFMPISQYIWDLSSLYTTGDVTLLALSHAPGDANGDGKATGADYTIWVLNLGHNGGFADGDFNGDGRVTGADYTVWAVNFTSAASMPLPIPEPSGLTIAAIGGLLLLVVNARRRNLWRV